MSKFRYKVIAYGHDLKNQYITHNFPTKDAAISYLKGWIKADDSMCGYEGKQRFRERTLPENNNSWHLYRDGEYVGSVTAERQYYGLRHRDVDTLSIVEGF